MARAASTHVATMYQLLVYHQTKAASGHFSLQIFWKCYEYGDNLVNIFEFIDDQRTKSVREVTISDAEATEEFIDKHGSIVR